MISLTKIIPNKEKALFLARKQLVDLVCDAVNLEGIHYTLPEVQTLLDGVTVGGHKLTDQTVTLNQAAAWQHLFHLVSTDQFEVSKKIICQLHQYAAKEEALKWGCFREGDVTIAGTDYVPPDYRELDTLWGDLLDEMNQIDNIYNRAIIIFLRMARYQFFYDVNKRMGRFMMNGLLLQNGYPVINLPAKKQLEFNQLMLDFYSSGDPSAMMEFMKNCVDERTIDIMSNY